MKFIMLLGLLFSCASPILSQKECEARGWNALGLKDGSAGRDAHIQLEKYTKVCAEHNVSVDSRQYLAAHKNGMKQYCTKTGLKDGRNGMDADYLKCSDHRTIYDKNRNIGLKSYCTYQSGIRNGSTGKVNQSYNCPSKKDFEKGYNEGLLTYCIPSKAFYAASQGKSYNSTLCVTNSAKISSAAQKGKELFTLNNEIKDLNERIDRLRNAKYEKESTSEERLNAARDYEKAKDELNQLNMRRMFLQGMANSFQ